MAKFTMADLLNSQSKKTEERPAFEIRHIPIDKLKPSAKNQYGIRGIKELAANIEMLGLLHNLDVKEADETGYYEIISGERRYQACKLLYESGNQEFKTLPCKVEALTENKAISELKLLYANAAARELTDYEKTYQAGRIKEILQALKKDGYKFQGRMREIVADMLDVSPAQMGRMESINKNLSPEFKEEFKAGNIGITTAYELSGQSEAEQTATLEAYKAEGAEAQPAQRRRHGRSGQQGAKTGLFGWEALQCIAEAARQQGICPAEEHQREACPAGPQRKADTSQHQRPAPGQKCRAEPAGPEPSGSHGRPHGAEQAEAVQRKCPEPVEQDAQRSSGCAGGKAVRRQAQCQPQPKGEQSPVENGPAPGKPQRKGPALPQGRAYRRPGGQRGGNRLLRVQFCGFRHEKIPAFRRGSFAMFCFPRPLHIL